MTFGIIGGGKGAFVLRKKKLFFNDLLIDRLVFSNYVIKKYYITGIRGNIMLESNIAGNVSKK
jgi:hypothetical protein